jgi:hypothetical protein
MFTSQREKCAEPHIIALVELDMQKMRVRFALARETIRERIQELKHPKDKYGERQGIQDASDCCSVAETRSVRTAKGSRT